MTEEIKREAKKALDELIQKADLSSGQVLVVGCSTSEVIGQRIGTHGSQDVAKALYEAFEEVSMRRGLNLAFQCCEHLNRAIVVERPLMERLGLEEVAAVPAPHAGGAMATEAYKKFEAPCLVEEIRADAGIDIGNTLIGMHLKRVAVPLRLENKRIGNAHVNAARTRPKYIGGIRAKYE